MRGLAGFKDDVAAGLVTLKYRQRRIDTGKMLIGEIPRELHAPDKLHPESPCVNMFSRQALSAVPAIGFLHSLKHQFSNVAMIREAARPHSAFYAV